MSRNAKILLVEFLLQHFFCPQVNEVIFEKACTIETVSEERITNLRFNFKAARAEVAFKRVLQCF
jgi:hypothetical protein